MVLEVPLGAAYRAQLLVVVDMLVQQLVIVARMEE
jgi:hypothetical protein